MPVFCMLNLLKYSSLRYGSEANQQACLWPGFELILKPPSPISEAPRTLASPKRKKERPVPGGDPEKTGGCRGKKKGNFSIGFLFV